MKTFPMFLRLAERTVVIVGGGEDAARKCRLMLKTPARIVLIAQAQVAELAGLAVAGRLRVRVRPEPGLFARSALVFVGTGCPGADAAWQALAKAEGAPVVNVVDAPDLCDAFTPAIVDRDPVVVAIGTEGTAPVLARQIKTRVEAMLEPSLGALAAAAGRLRALVERHVPRERRRGFWRWVFAGPPRRTAARDGVAAAEAEMRAAIASGLSDPAALVSLIEVPADGADLLTLRAVARLQEADLIVHDRDVPSEALELARRDAARMERTGIGWEDALAETVAGGRNGVVMVTGGAPALRGSLEAIAGDALEVVPAVASGGGTVVALR